MRLSTVLSVALASVALQFAPASAAPMHPAQPAIDSDASVTLAQYGHRRMRRGCRFSHGRLVCGGHGGDRDRGDRRRNRHGERSHH